MSNMLAGFEYEIVPKEERGIRFFTGNAIDPATHLHIGIGPYVDALDQHDFADLQVVVYRTTGDEDQHLYFDRTFRIQEDLNIAPQNMFDAEFIEEMLDMFINRAASLQKGGEPFGDEVFFRPEIEYMKEHGSYQDGEVVMREYFEKKRNS